MTLIQTDIHTFMQLGRENNPLAKQNDYEALWLGASSPFLKEGSITLLTSGDGKARLCLLSKPGETKELLKNLFCFYAPPRNWEEKAKHKFFSDLKTYCKSQGIKSLTGPMQFSTWHPYRFISEAGSYPFFPGEQPLPVEWHRDFTEAGFSSLAEYESVLVSDLAGSIEIGNQMGVHKALPQLELQHYEGNSFKEIAGELFSLSLKIFENNFGYSPISFEEFAGILVDHAPPATYLVTASRGGRLMGFAYSYGIGEWAESTLHTSVLKTLGVHPDFRKLKVGYGLSYLTHKYWLEKGYGQIIHAYMKTDNASRSMSGHFGNPIRKYQLVHSLMEES